MIMSHNKTIAIQPENDFKYFTRTNFNTGQSTFSQNLCSQNLVLDIQDQNSKLFYITPADRITKKLSRDRGFSKSRKSRLRLSIKLMTKRDRILQGFRLA